MTKEQAKGLCLKALKENVLQYALRSALARGYADIMEGLEKGEISPDRYDEHVARLIQRANKVAFGYEERTDTEDTVDA